MASFAVLVHWNLRWEWSRAAALAAAAGIFMGILVALSNVIRPAEFQEFVTDLPPAMQSMIGLAQGRIFTIDRWLAIAHSHPLWLVIVLVFPIYFPLAAFARRMDDGSLEAILAQPVGRTRYYLASAFSTALGIAFVVAVSALGGLVASWVAELPEPVRPRRFLELTLSGAALAWSVAGVSLLASAALAGRGRPGAWTLGVVVVLYFVEYLSRIWADFRWAGALSLFHYHDTQGVVTDGLSAAHLAVLFGTGFLLAAAGLVVFRRRGLRF